MATKINKAFDLLVKDHKKVKGIISELMETASNAKKSRLNLLEELESEIVLHEKIEESILYPALKGSSSTKELTLEAYQEHHVVDILLNELKDPNISPSEFKAKLTVLQENLEHHIQEEEGQLFPKASELLTASKLDKLATDMKEMKAEA